MEKYGALGLFRSHEIPKIKAIVVEKPGLDVACGAIGIGEITSIPTAPAITDAYFRYDGERRLSLPIRNTPYERKNPDKKQAAYDRQAPDEPHVSKERKV